MTLSLDVDQVDLRPLQERCHHTSAILEGHCTVSSAAARRGQPLTVLMDRLVALGLGQWMPHVHVKIMCSMGVAPSLTFTHPEVVLRPECMQTGWRLWGLHSLHAAATRPWNCVTWRATPDVWDRNICLSVQATTHMSHVGKHGPAVRYCNMWTLV